MVKLTINGQAIQVPEETTILEAAKKSESIFRICVF